MAELIRQVGGITLVRTDGKRIDLSFFDDVGPISWGHFWVLKNGLYGYMNELGILICVPKYDYADDFDCSGHATVGIKDKFGIIDYRGQEICHLIYDEIYNFRNNYAKVVRDGQVMFMDKYGLEVQYYIVEKLQKARTWYETPEYQNALERFKNECK